MSAQPLRKPDPEHPQVWAPKEPADNRIYVIPPWAVAPVKKRSLWTRLCEKIEDSRSLHGMKVEVISVAIVLVLLGLTWVGVRGLYRFKSAEGVQLVNEAHGPNLLPFLR